jgi:hypothetical protein
MILKIDGLTLAQFASLTSFLASEENIIKEANVVDHLVVNSKGNPPAMFATLITSKDVGKGEHNVVLQLVETFTSDEPEEAFLERRKRGNYNSLGRNTEERRVPAHYLLGLVQATGRFPEK